MQWSKLRSNVKSFICEELRDRVDFHVTRYHGRRSARARTGEITVDGKPVLSFNEDNTTARRYSPPEGIGCEKKPKIGRPDPEHISTSFVERQNLSVRMNIRRYTRLTNAFSRKIENHSAAVALYYFSYNFVKIHRSLRTTPAMAAGVTDRLWEVSDLVALLEADERELPRAA